MSDIKDRNLSRYQAPTLRWIRDHRVTYQDLRRFNGTTISSLAYLGFIAKSGTGDAAEIVCTQAGENALRPYEEKSFNERRHEYDITERCQRLLKHVRRMQVVPLAKTAS